MNLITKRDLIRSAAERWHAQYGKMIDNGEAYAFDAAKILVGLRSLDCETATADDVARVTGSSGWCVLECMHCRADVEQVVRLTRQYPPALGYSTQPDEAEEQDRHAFMICGSCVLQVFKLLEQYR